MAIATRLEPYAARLRVASALVLLGIAVLTVWFARRSSGRSGVVPASSRDLLPWQAFGAFLAYCRQPHHRRVLLGGRLGNPDLAEGWGEGVVFVIAAFVASASWQLTLALLGPSWAVR